MKKALMIVAMLALATPAMAAGILDDSSGYSATAPVDLFGNGWTCQFNNGTTFVDANLPAAWPATDNGHTVGSFYGGYVGGLGSTRWVTYTNQSSPVAFTEQDIEIALTVLRDDTTSQTKADPVINVKVNDALVTSFAVPDSFGNAASGATVQGVSNGGYLMNPIVKKSYTITGLNVAVGDKVQYTMTWQSSTKKTGLAMSITPEPATMSLLGIGALALLRRKK